MQSDNKLITIYGIFDPRDGVIQYIGQTARPLKSRLYDHTYIGRIDKLSSVGGWISSLLKEGIQPKIVALEVVPEMEANERERQLILQYHNENPLKNIVFTGQISPRNASIKKKQEELFRRRLARWKATHSNNQNTQIQIRPRVISGEEIKAWRVAHRWTQRQLGEALGYDESTISYWESGKRWAPEWVPLELEKLQARDTTRGPVAGSHQRKKETNDGD